MQHPHYNKDLVVRILTAEDLPRAHQVGGRAFGGHCEDWYGTETTLGGFDQEGTLVCLLKYKPESLWWGPAQIPAAAIGAVATEPKHQGQGHAGGLMVQAIHFLREQGYFICPLWPFSYRWYGKFGWACPAPVLELKLWPDLVRQTSAAPGLVRRATAEDAPSVHRLYTEGAQLRNGQSVRSEQFWQEENRLTKLWVLEGEHNQLDSCAVVEIEDMHRVQGKKLTVRELHGASFANQLRLVRSLAELDQIVTLRLEEPADSLFLQAFPERFDIALKHTMDLRVLDVAQALGHLKAPDELRAKLSFEVADWVVDPAKPQRVTVQAEGGQVAVKKGASKDALRCDINTFSQLFAGGLSVAQTRRLGQLAGGNPKVDAACDALLWGRAPHRSGLEAG